MNQANEKEKNKETRKDRLNKKIVMLKKEYKDLHITDSNVRPRLTESNIETLLFNKGINVKFNEVSKDISIDNLKNDEKMNKIIKSDTLVSYIEDEIDKEDFHSISYDKLYRKLDSIAYKNTYNPVKSYLKENYKKNKDKITSDYNTLSELINILKVRKDEQELTNMLVKKWLISCVACHFDDNFVSHGCLTLKGEQGIGKTTFFRRLIPEYLKK